MKPPRWLAANAWPVFTVLVVPVVGWFLSLQVQVTTLRSDVDSVTAATSKIDIVQECVQAQAIKVAVIQDSLSGIKDDLRVIKQAVLKLPLAPDPTPIAIGAP